MALAAGSTLGHYEVQGLIGKGGMGEVYRALDTKLQRDVAIKILPPQFARDPERVSRFKREATLLASLNHPNIAQIYGVEDSGETHYLVMEYVPGLTLAEQLLKGSVEVDEALRITSQICEALEHAHEKTVIHRDLKPANVKLTPEGKVKVLDFGLAKAFAGETVSGGAAPLPVIDSNSPTLSHLPTGYQPPDLSPTLPGVILGTAAYMSPEQAKGKRVDRRTDIWALGCVLYELLTGQGAFYQSRARKQAVAKSPGIQPLPPGRGSDGGNAEPDTVQEIIAAVLKGEPEWTLLPEATPASIRSLLRRCLEKDARRRYHAAADVLIQLEEVGTTHPVTPAEPLRRSLPIWRKSLPWVAGFALVVLSGLSGWYLRPGDTPKSPIMRFAITLPGGDTIAATGPGANRVRVALSPDGTRLAWVASRGPLQQLFVRDLGSDSSEIKPIAGTEGAEGPFFSPDGQWIGFFASGKLKKVPVSGGATLTLSDAPAGRGASWAPEGMIYFTPSAVLGTGIHKVPAAGGTAEQITRPDIRQQETTHRWPEMLPGGKVVLFVIQPALNSDPETWQIAALSLGTGEKKVLIRGGTYPRYVPSGHLVYYHRGTIMAVPFDIRRLEVGGNPAPVLEGVMAAGNIGGAQFAFSEGGSLVYVPGGSRAPIERSMVWVDRKGVEQPIPAPPRTYAAPKLSPDGRYVAAQISGSHWIYDLIRNTLTRLTFDGNATLLMWTPDSKRIAFMSDKTGSENLFWKPADGSGPEEQLTKSENRQLPGSFTPDGKTLIYTEQTPTSPSDIWVMPLEGDRKPRLWLGEPFSENAARLSPDGRWMGYASDESGVWEIYVRPFPGPGGKWQISSEGGAELVWSPRGNELFYRTGPNRERMMAVDIQTEPTFNAGNPRLVFEGNYVANQPGSPGNF